MFSMSWENLHSRINFPVQATYVNVVLLIYTRVWPDQLFGSFCRQSQDRRWVCLYLCLCVYIYVYIYIYIYMMIIHDVYMCICCGCAWVCVCVGVIVFIYIHTRFACICIALFDNPAQKSSNLMQQKPQTLTPWT